MTTNTKILFGVSLTTLALSLTGVLWGLFLPIGVICIGLFMIFNLLGKEMALYDEEQQLRASLAKKNSLISQPVQSTHREVALAAAPAR